MLSVRIIALHGHAFDCACPIPNALIGGIDQDQLGHAGAGLARTSAAQICYDELRPDCGWRIDPDQFHSLLRELTCYPFNVEDR